MNHFGEATGGTPNREKTNLSILTWLCIVSYHFIIAILTQVEITAYVIYITIIPCNS